MNNDEIYIFAHIPKTGGTTLDRHFEKHMTLHVDYIPLSGPGEQRAIAQGLKPFKERSLEDRMKAKVILGHQVRWNTHELVPGKKPRYIVLIREPISWIVSRYNWAMKVRRERNENIISFDEWFEETKHRQSQLFWFLRNFAETKFIRRMPGPRRLRRMNEIIEQFSMVTTTERLDEDGAKLLHLMGLPDELERKNVAGVDHDKILKVTDELRERLEEDMATDLQLYRQWKAKSPLIQWS